MGQLLSLCVSKTDILYERFMRLRCKRHSPASPGKRKLHLLAKSPVHRYARARLEILPVKTVKRGEARQLELATFSREKVIECPNAKKHSIIFKDRLNYLWSSVGKKIKRKKREKWPTAIEKIIGNVFFDAHLVLKE